MGIAKREVFYEHNFCLQIGGFGFFVGDGCGGEFGDEVEEVFEDCGRKWLLIEVSQFLVKIRQTDVGLNAVHSDFRQFEFEEQLCFAHFGVRRGSLYRFAVRSGLGHSFLLPHQLPFPIFFVLVIVLIGHDSQQCPTYFLYVIDEVQIIFLNFVSIFGFVLVNP
jgi:hypothetical protein